MDYRLHRNGQDAGSFPLEELRRRRGAGELSGTEFVWRTGMANWEPLDSVLAASGLGVPANAVPPPATPGGKGGRLVGTALCSSPSNFP